MVYAERPRCFLQPGPLGPGHGWEGSSLAGPLSHALAWGLVGISTWPVLSSPCFLSGSDKGKLPVSTGGHSRPGCCQPPPCEPPAPWAALAPLGVCPQQGVPAASVVLGAGGQLPRDPREAALRPKVLFLRGESLLMGQFVLGT